MHSKQANGNASTVALTELKEIVSKKSLFFIFDRDGTLVPFSDSPELAVIDPTVQSTLNELVVSCNAQVAIVSARGLSSLANEFEPNNLILAGNYGLEISFPSGKRFLHSAAVSALSEMIELEDMLTVIVARECGLILDRHKYSLCLHFHKLPSHKHNKLHLLIQKLSQSFPTLFCRRLSTSYEFLPPCKWDKSNAIDEIVEQISPRETPFFVVFGDSEADEPMYSWVNKHNGLSFNIGSKVSSNARVRLHSPEELRTLLLTVLECYKANHAI